MAKKSVMKSALEALPSRGLTEEQLEAEREVADWLQEQRAAGEPVPSWKDIHKALTREVRYPLALRTMQHRLAGRCEKS